MNNIFPHAESLIHYIQDDGFGNAIDTLKFCPIEAADFACFLVDDGNEFPCFHYYLYDVWEYKTFNSRIG